MSVLGFRLLSRGPAALAPGEVTAIDAGNIVISLMLPPHSGDLATINERTRDCHSCTPPNR